ncbi:hypothetical protein [Kitasatospora sp. NPDC050543]|uniref:hypothetical protein n=1 Tax=Kitasatospora sp. NPDC050543 TaxID=3364054 RepID=UPI0037A662E7
MVLFLLLVIIAIVLGLIGAVADGLWYLLLIAIVLFVADLAFFGVRWWRRAGRRPLR